MIVVVADAAVLVAELLRTRGRQLVERPDLRVLVTEPQGAQTEHEIERRLEIIVERGPLTVEQAAQLRDAVVDLVTRRVIDVVPQDAYQHLQAAARRRIPRDPTDWPTVALSLALDIGIWATDNDFLGCGRPTWTTQTLRQELDSA